MQRPPRRLLPRMALRRLLSTPSLLWCPALIVHDGRWMLQMQPMAEVHAKETDIPSPGVVRLWSRCAASAPHPSLVHATGLHTSLRASSVRSS